MVEVQRTPDSPEAAWLQIRHLRVPLERPRAQSNTSTFPSIHHASTNTAAYGHTIIYLCITDFNIDLPAPIPSFATSVSSRLNPRIPLRHAWRIQSQDPPWSRRILRQRQNFRPRPQRPETKESHPHRLRRWSNKQCSRPWQSRFQEYV